MAYELPQLPYPYDTLEPHIDEVRVAFGEALGTSLLNVRVVR